MGLKERRAPRGGCPWVPQGGSGHREASDSLTWHLAAVSPSLQPLPLPRLLCTFAHSSLGQECPLSALFQQDSSGGLRAYLLLSKALYMLN